MSSEKEVEEGVWQDMQKVCKETPIDMALENGV